MIWSMAMVMKSMYMISAIGRMPMMALPTAQPISAASEIGASFTCSGPNSCSSPAEAPNRLPQRPTSSPIR